MIEIIIGKIAAFCKAINIAKMFFNWADDIFKRLKQDGLLCPYCGYKTLQKSHEVPWSEAACRNIIASKYHNNFYICSRKKCSSDGKPISDSEIYHHMLLKQPKN